MSSLMAETNRDYPVVSTSPCYESMRGADRWGGPGPCSPPPGSATGHYKAMFLYRNFKAQITSVYDVEESCLIFIISLTS
jgi:hypothetical protein